MTDNEIIKALEYCSNPHIGCSTDCPLKGKACRFDMPKFALDLINRQKAEIERLQKEQDLFADIGKMYSEIKAEAVKEFAGELERSLINMPQKDINYSSLVEHIENLVKETVGEMDG